MIADLRLPVSAWQSGVIGTVRSSLRRDLVRRFPTLSAGLGRRDWAVGGEYVHQALIVASSQVASRESSNALAPTPP